MSRTYSRDWRGRFSSGGGLGPMTPVSNGRGGTRQAEFRKRRTGYTPTNSPKGGNARLYVQRSGRTQRAVAVSQLKNGRLTAPKDSLTTRRAIGGRTGVGSGKREYLGSTRTRVGSPIGGNRNLRYVSRGHVVTRSVGAPTSALRIGGRLNSSAINRGARRTNIAPRTGYVVQYGPQVKTG